MSEVSISSNETQLLATVGADEGETVAFYVFRDNERIHIQWYSPSRELSFDHQSVPGVYRVTAFVRRGDAEPVIKSSREIIIFGRRLDLPEVEAMEPGNRPMLVRSGDHDFHCLLHVGKQKRLFVLLTAAVNRPCTMPIFNRWMWRDRFPGSVLCISDPTLARCDELGIGWYLGSEERDATSDMAELVTAIVRKLDIEMGNVISYGSSAGGFSAMALASRLPGSMAVAVNPQTDVTKYSQRRVAEMMACCFPGRTLDEVIRRYAARLDMVGEIPRSGARTLIVQNTEDHEHWLPHFLPFAQATGLPAASGISADGRHASIVYSHESGHAAEPPEVFEQIMKYVTEACVE